MLNDDDHKEAEEDDTKLESESELDTTLGSIGHQQQPQ